jgi:[ribosomal protein S5]-alanine N-acetyltransferase
VTAARIPERLETERIVCERPRTEHTSDLARLLRDPRVARTLLTSGRPATDAELMENMLAKEAHWASHGFGMWMLYDHSSGSFLGRGGLQYSRATGREEVEIGWAIVPDRWGEGLATELALASAGVAFETLGLDQLVALTLVDNLASRRVMEKSGFAHERDFEHVGLLHALYRRVAWDADSARARC